MRLWLIPVATCVICQFALTRIAQAGGMSAGGGNFLHTIPPENPGPTAVAETTVSEAHENLAAYLRGKKQAWAQKTLPAPQHEAFAPLFSSGRDVLSIIANRQLSVESQEPCRDAQGTEVDGSIFTNNPWAVCLSAWTLSRKTVVGDYYPQSLALLSHEFSELAGLSEEEAVRLQEQILLDVRSSLNK